jgi:hypothetical protein
MVLLELAARQLVCVRGWQWLNVDHHNSQMLHDRAVTCPCIRFAYTSGSFLTVPEMLYICDVLHVCFALLFTQNFGCSAVSTSHTSCM